MRSDAMGLFWEEISPKIEKQRDLLIEQEWAEVLPGFWVEQWRLDNGDDPRTHCLSQDKAYQQARANKSGTKRTPPEPVWLYPDYLPFLQEAQSFVPNLFTDQELVEAANEWIYTGDKHELEYDIECYPNYFLIAFISYSTGKIIEFELSPWAALDIAKLKWVFDNFRIVGFNSINYDAVIAALAVAGKSNAVMKAATSAIIEYNERGYTILKHNKVKKLKLDHIDLKEVAPLFGSLKIYGGRMHCKRMQDLPFAPETILSREQASIVRWYCVNDLTTTSELKLKLKKELDLRKMLGHEYGMDLRSKSDAQIAEAVIRHEVEQLNGGRVKVPEMEPGRVYYYEIPHFLQFQTPLMRDTLHRVASTQFVVSEKGNVGMPENLKDLKIQIGNSVYRMGIGGLHSSESKTAHFAGPNVKLVDRDVSSFYPWIILNLGLYPEQLGPNFLTVYRTLVERRLHAKANGDKSTADSLKITINGTFGKLGNAFSCLYSPNLLIQVTLTGQLSLLMLIEALEMSGIPVVSANTDGLVIKCPKQREHTMDQVVTWWENTTGFSTDETPYKALYSRDVNNYIAIKDPSTWKPEDKIDDKVKTKGVFAKTGLSKNPQSEICIHAIKELLINGAPIRQTITTASDIRKFVVVRTVKGGAVKVWEKRPLPEHDTKEELIALAGMVETYGGNYKWLGTEDMQAVRTDVAYEEAKNKLEAPIQTDYLGKAIRWYYAKGIQGEIIYASSGNKVPKSDGARPLMVIPDQFPDDVDYDWYERETLKILRQIDYPVPS